MRSVTYFLLVFLLASVDCDDAIQTDRQTDRQKDRHCETVLETSSDTDREATW